MGMRLTGSIGANRSTEEMLEEKKQAAIRRSVAGAQGRHAMEVEAAIQRFKSAPELAPQGSGGYQDAALAATNVAGSIKGAVDANRAAKAATGVKGATAGMTVGQGAAAANAVSQGLQAAGVMSDGSDGSTTGGVASGMASGAAAGAAFGPYGAAIGGALGGVTGAMKAKSARRKMRADAEAEKEEKKSKIMGDKEKRVQAAMETMAGNMGMTLRSVG